MACSLCDSSHWHVWCSYTVISWLPFVEFSSQLLDWIHEPAVRCGIWLRGIRRIDALYWLLTLWMRLSCEFCVILTEILTPLLFFVSCFLFYCFFSGYFFTMWTDCVIESLLWATENFVPTDRLCIWRLGCIIRSSYRMYSLSRLLFCAGCSCLFVCLFSVVHMKEQVWNRIPSESRCSWSECSKIWSYYEWIRPPIHSRSRSSVLCRWRAHCSNSSISSF